MICDKEQDRLEETSMPVKEGGDHMKWEIPRLMDLSELLVQHGTCATATWSGCACISGGSAP